MNTSEKNAEYQILNKSGRAIHLALAGGERRGVSPKICFSLAALGILR